MVYLELLFLAFLGISDTRSSYTPKHAYGNKLSNQAPNIVKSNNENYIQNTKNSTNSNLKFNENFKSMDTCKEVQDKISNNLKTMGYSMFVEDKNLKKSPVVSIKIWMNENGLVEFLPECYSEKCGLIEQKPQIMKDYIPMGTNHYFGMGNNMQPSSITENDKYDIEECDEYTSKSLESNQINDNSTKKHGSNNLNLGQTESFNNFHLTNTQAMNNNQYDKDNNKPSNTVKPAVNTELDKLINNVLSKYVQNKGIENKLNYNQETEKNNSLNNKDININEDCEEPSTLKNGKNINNMNHSNSQQNTEIITQTNTNTHKPIATPASSISNTISSSTYNTLTKNVLPTKINAINPISVMTKIPQIINSAPYETYGTLNQNRNQHDIDTKIYNGLGNNVQTQKSVSQKTIESTPISSFTKNQNNPSIISKSVNAENASANHSSKINLKSEQSDCNESDNNPKGKDTFPDQNKMSTYNTNINDLNSIKTQKPISIENYRSNANNIEGQIPKNKIKVSSNQAKDSTNGSKQTLSKLENLPNINKPNNINNNSVSLKNIDIPNKNKSATNDLKDQIMSNRNNDQKTDLGKDQVFVNGKGSIKEKGYENTTNNQINSKPDSISIKSNIPSIKGKPEYKKAITEKKKENNTKEIQNLPKLDQKQVVSSQNNFVNETSKSNVTENKSDNSTFSKSTKVKINSENSNKNTTDKGKDINNKNKETDYNTKKDLKNVSESNKTELKENESEIKDSKAKQTKGNPDNNYLKNDKVKTETPKNDTKEDKKEDNKENDKESSKQNEEKNPEGSEAKKNEAARTPFLIRTYKPY